SEGANRRLYE
ncbi:unnamed protein product, partial [Allacma fusca]